MNPDMHELRFALGPHTWHTGNKLLESGVSDGEPWMVSARRRPFSGLTCRRSFIHSFIPHNCLLGTYSRGAGVNKTDRTPRLGDGDIPVAGDRQDTEWTAAMGAGDGNLIWEPGQLEGWGCHPCNRKDPSFAEGAAGSFGPEAHPG